MKSYQEFITESTQARKFNKKKVEEWTKKVMHNYSDSESGRFQFDMNGRTSNGFRQDELDYGWSFIEARTRKG
ncbi:hypothetical protein fHeYen901_164 [Yersinia phage fHe-Yen9-01]|uniref:Uncharacterized protein n=1 Tax=Yersinia phage fHe-Yen9-01 TaxID=1965363 RepID=A0A1V0DXQ9_9CAUD|nr:hypothetical protein KNT60_gp163 [Yersinia phage fHe-Yen9-01]ARB05937.1 hypothetical protein fHeYen901_164 [Yersinia phage fHe-Yen9-01]